VLVRCAEQLTARQRRMSFATRHGHLSVPGPRAAMSSLELQGSSQDEGPPTPSILVMSPHQATADSEHGHLQPEAGDTRNKSTKSTKSGRRRKNTKLSGAYVAVLHALFVRRSLRLACLRLRVPNYRTDRTSQAAKVC